MHCTPHDSRFVVCIIFAAVYWIAPVRPYATLNVSEGNSFLEFSPDGTVLVTKGESSAFYECWDVEKGVKASSIPFAFPGHAPRYFSPDSKLIAVYDSERRLRIWNARTGEETAMPETEGVFVPTISFSPDGAFMAIQSYHDERPGCRSPDGEWKRWNGHGDFFHDYIRFWNIESRRWQKAIWADLRTLAFAQMGSRLRRT